MHTAGFYVCLGTFVVVAAAMTLLILIQKGRGVQSVFGGSGGDSIFGHRTPGAVTWLTAIAFAVFLVLVVVLNRLA